MTIHPDFTQFNLKNIMINTDSYKVSMWKQYPPGTQYVYSYVESRGGRWDRHVFFGLQMFIKEYLNKPFTKQDIDEAEVFWTLHGEPFNRAGWDYILEKHKGFLPLVIKAVPEGTVLGTKNVLATVVNTDPEVYWLTTWIETALLRAIWYPTTVATLSFHAKIALRRHLLKTSDNPDQQLLFKLHDFGARGTETLESAGLGGAAHLVNFMGTDTAIGALYAAHYYGGGMPGFSIPAAEHSTITSWGRPNEVKAYENMLNQFGKPGALVAVVSDSYDLWNAIDNLWGGELRQKVIDSGATLIVRPDSGDPTIVPVEAVKRLAVKFGYTVNSKGYKVLNHVRVIQGDGINDKSLEIILENLTAAGFATENIAFGMGGGLLQQVDRDTLKFAMKCSAICINGVWSDVYKDPIDDPGKKSKVGQLALVYVDGEATTMRAEGHHWEDAMRRVWRNGEHLIDETFEEVRERAAQPFNDNEKWLKLAA